MIRMTLVFQLLGFIAYGFIAGEAFAYRIQEAKEEGEILGIVQHIKSNEQQLKVLSEIQI